jgi:anti-sigma factor RsiW
MSCEGFRSLVTAYVDGELTGEERAAFEAHVAECEACAHRLADERQVVAAVEGSLPLYDVPTALRERVGELMVARPARRARTPWPAVAAALAAALVAVALWLPRPAGESPRRASSFASLAADTHLRFARGQLPLEVASDRPEAVSRWFEGRVPFHMKLPEYPVGPGEEKFYRLEGGRLVSFHDDYAAYVAYRMEGEPISLLVTSASRVRPEGGSTVASGNLVFHVESVAGLKVITWTDNGLTYALASDVAVSGARSCLVCHGSREERRKIEGFPGPRT